MDLLHDQMKFVLLHSRHQNGVKEVMADYSYRIGSFRYAGKESSMYLFALLSILRHRPKVIVHEYSIGILSLYPVFLLARWLGIKFVLWGHGYDHTRGFHPERSRADRLRVRLAKKADAVIFYGTEARKKFSPYVNPEKLFVAPNCLNTRRLTAIRDRLEAEGREAVKRRIGFKQPYNLLFIGRVLASKKPELLISAYEQLKQQMGDVLAVHYVGDGPHLDVLKAMVVEKGLKNRVFFHGAIHDDPRSGAYLYASDLMIMPGYVGLSVNHALNFDCPVVTFEQQENGPFHSPEIEYLVPGKTGFLLTEHTTRALTKTISQYLSDTAKQQEMKQYIRRMVEQVCSVEHFISNYKEAVHFALEASPNQQTLKNADLGNKAQSKKDLIGAPTASADSRGQHHE